jgi:hypothetical protein
MQRRNISVACLAADLLHPVPVPLTPSVDSSRRVVDGICILVHSERTAWEVEFTDEFGEWWDSFRIEEQESVRVKVELLAELGPALTRPHADTIHGSRVQNLRELRIQHQGRPYRVLYAFDPRRTGVLLIGGDKTGNPRWYAEFVPVAEDIYIRHLQEIGEE